MPKNMFWVCGQPVHALLATCGEGSGFPTSPTPPAFVLGKTRAFAHYLYQFCTQLLHTPLAHFTSVKNRFSHPSA